MTRLQAEFQRYLVEFLAGARDFSFFIEFRLALGNTHPVKGAHFPQVKRPRCKDDHLPPFSAEVQDKWSSTSTVTYIDMACPRTSASQLIDRCHCILKVNPHSNRYISWESYNIMASWGVHLTGSAGEAKGNRPTPQSKLPKCFRQRWFW
jgi:hypothetical protein